jgi:hypothetical protein
MADDPLRARLEELLSAMQHGYGSKRPEVQLYAERLAVLLREPPAAAPLVCPHCGATAGVMPAAQPIGGQSVYFDGRTWRCVSCDKVFTAELLELDAAARAAAPEPPR